MPATYPTETHPAGTTLDYSIDGGSNYINLADVTKLTPSAMKRNVGKKTKLSATSLAMSKIRSWIDAGQIKVTIQYKGSIYSTLYALFIKGPQDSYEKYRITFPLVNGTSVGATLIWNGFISEFPLSDADVEADKVYEMDITIEVDLLPTYTAAS